MKRSSRSTFGRSGSLRSISRFLAPAAALLLVTIPHHARAADAQLQWSKEQPAVGGDGIEANAIAVDASGDVVVAMTMVATADWLTVKYSGATGDVIWSKVFAGPANGDDQAEAIAVDANGDVVVTGTVSTAAGTDFSVRDIQTIKYRGSDGAVLWQKQHNGPGNGEDAPTAVSVMSNGDVVVAGSVFAGNPASSYFEQFDMYTVRYSGSTGDVVWQRTFDGGAAKHDSAARVIVDGSDNVYICGRSTKVSFRSTDRYVAKLAGSTGQAVWEYFSNFVEPEGVTDIALDPSGNVVALGFANSGGLTTYTSKLAAADGQPLWSQVYRRRDDVPEGLAVDAAGNAFITVSSREPDGEFDFYTAKYAAADGAVLWERLDDTTDLGSDRPRGLILDGAGNSIVVGESRHGETYTISYSSNDGSTLWDERFDNNGNGTSPIVDYPVAATPDNGFVILGKSFYSNLDRVTVAKFVVTGGTGPTPTPPPGGSESRMWVAGRDLATFERVSGPAVGTNTRVPQWSYGHRATIDGTAFTPFAAGAHTDAEQNRAAVQGWASPTGVVLVNTSSQPEQYFAAGKGYQLLPEQMMLRRVSTAAPFPVVRWTAPADGSYRVLAKWFDLKATSNAGAAHVLVNGTQVFGRQQNGAFVGQEWENEGNAAMPTKTFELRAGDVVDFVLSTRVGNNQTATEDTGFNAVIARVPAVAIASPSSGSQFGGGSDVNVAVNVGHAFAIKSVTLRINAENAPLPADTSAPYEFTLPQLAPGIYNITAVATDEFGAESLSAPVQIVVNKTGASAQTSGAAKLAQTTGKAATSGRTFRCTQSGSWGDAATWGGEGVPGSTDDAIIPAGLTVDLNDRHQVDNLDLAGQLVANDLIFNPSLRVFGTLLARGARLGGPGLPAFVIESSGRLVVTNGTTVFAGGDLFNNGKTTIGENGQFIQSNSRSTLDTSGTFQMQRTPGSNQPTLARFGDIKHRGGLILLTSNSHLISDNSSTILGSNGAGLISDNGSTLIGNNGNTLIGNNGNTLISEGQGALVGADGAGVIGPNGAQLIGLDGAGLVGADGAGILGTNGAGMVAAGGLNAVADRVQRDGSKPGETSIKAAEQTNGFVLEGGAITGNIRFTGNVLNKGAYLSPGSSAGLIEIVGNYRQDQNGTLVLEVGGSLDHQIDNLSITGTATLGGKLIVKTTNSFEPQSGQTFAPIDYAAVQGQFASVTSNARVNFDGDGMTMQVSGPNPPAPKALNIATRMRVETGDNVLIAGFIITGDQPKRVLVRGIGPSLPVSGALADPTLDLDAGTFFNDDWRTDQQGEIEGTTIPPLSDLESAIVATLDPGAHTAVLRGKNNGTGVGLVEVYDLESGSPVQLANISTRGQVQTGDNVMIGGFIIGGNYPAKVLLRAIGPSLPVDGALQDPTLELVDANGATISNDNWRSTQEAEIIDTTVPPTNDREAAIVANLVPGQYTAIVRGKDDTIGVALVEAFNLE